MNEKFIGKINLPTVIMHNGQLADPSNAIAKAMKKITSNRKKTDADYDKLAELEFTGGLYTNKKGEVILPGRVIESAIHAGAKKSKEGKDCLSALFVDNDPVISYDGGPLPLDKLVKSEAHRLTVGVKVGQARVMRTRPFFENVSFTVEMTLNTELVNPDRLERWLEDCLNQCGIGDWRPRHGRGVLLSFEAVSVPLKAVK